MLWVLPNPMQSLISLTVRLEIQVQHEMAGNPLAWNVWGIGSVIDKKRRFHGSKFPGTKTRMMNHFKHYCNDFECLIPVLVHRARQEQLSNIAWDDKMLILTRGAWNAWNTGRERNRLKLSKLCSWDTVALSTKDWAPQISTRMYRSQEYIDINARFICRNVGKFDVCGGLSRDFRKNFSPVFEHPFLGNRHSFFKSLWIIKTWD